MCKIIAALSTAGAFAAAALTLCSASPLPGSGGKTPGPTDPPGSSSPIDCISTTIETLDIYGTPAKLSGKVTTFDLSAGAPNLGNLGKIYETDGENGVRFHATTDSDAATIVLRNEANKANVDYVYMMDTQSPGGMDGIMHTDTLYYYLFQNDECIVHFDGAPTGLSVSAIVPKDGGHSQG